MIVDYSHIVAFIIGVFTRLFTREIYDFVKNKLKYRTETIEMPVTLEFKNVDENEREFLELKYSVLLVRHGKDEVKESGKLLNKMFKFEGYNPKVAKLRVHKVLGAQFKCFVDYKSEDQFGKIKSFLEKNGFKEVSHDDDKFKKRAWFIHPDYSTCTTVDGYINNFVHPPSYRK
jgi:hypothetical protein